MLSVPLADGDREKLGDEEDVIDSAGVALAVNEGDTDALAKIDNETETLGLEDPVCELDGVGSDDGVADAESEG